MNDQDRLHRIKLLKNRHTDLHKTIDVLEAEKAPEKFIKKHKVEKLRIKDEICYLESIKIG